MKGRLLGAAGGALIVAATGSDAGASPALRAEDGRFVDASGRTVILRGVDVAGDSKVPPFRPAADPAVFDPLARLGMNVVRLLFTWEAFEPEKGSRDEGYLDYYASAARAAGERGLRVIVDIHQDGFSRASIGGCGDGFPLWALPAGVTPDAPDNGPACKSWGIAMQSDEDMMTAWSAFHADTEGVRTAYLDMLRAVSERLSSEPAVIGYDLLNEPWGDEATEIGPLLADGAAAVREKSPDAIVFVSPHARTSAGSQTALERPTFANFAYSPHFYDASVILFHSWSGVEPDAPFQGMKDKAAEWGAPLFVGELGAPAPTENGAEYVASLYRHLDDSLASGAQWVYTPGWTEERKDGWNDEDFSIVDGSGALRANHRPRPYPPAIGGAPVRFRVNDAAAPEDRSVELVWDAEPYLVTEVFAPAAAFFESDSLVVEAEGQGLSCTAGGDRVWCVSSSAGERRIEILGRRPVEPPRCGLVGVEMIALLPLLELARALRRSRGSGAGAPVAPRGSGAGMRSGDRA